MLALGQQAQTDPRALEQIDALARGDVFERRMALLSLHRLRDSRRLLPFTQDAAATLRNLGNGYAHEAIEAMRCIRAGLLESPVMPHADSVALMHNLDTMRGQIGLVYRSDHSAEQA